MREIQMKTFFVTTPIYYVNDVPHLGHLYTTLAADILTRYYKQKGATTFFLTGTDEHGAKIAQAAKEAGLEPKAYVDSIAPRFQQAWKEFDIDYDYFIRTTHPEHETITQEILQKLYAKGDIYKGTYEGLYCIGCEKFLIETDLSEGKCPFHPTQTPVQQKEENYFFRLSRYIPILLKAIEDPHDPHHYEILPPARRNEVVSKLKQGVSDLSISRAQVSWGIPIPWDSTQTIYVWFEALLNYYTATHIVGKPTLWPATVHLVGKDVLWFHAVIWEAMLIAADLALPKTVFAHGFFTINGQKMSKSLGNVISPAQLKKRFGTDATRYLLFTNLPFGQDSDISLTHLTDTYNADLANGVGNLVARVAALAHDHTLLTPEVASYQLPEEYEKALATYQLHDAVFVIKQHIVEADRVIDQNRLWELVRSDKQRATVITVDLIHRIRAIASLLSPFCPSVSREIARRFSGPLVQMGPSLFPRLR